MFSFLPSQVGAGDEGVTSDGAAETSALQNGGCDGRSTLEIQGGGGPGSADAWLDLDATVDKAIALIEEAGAKGAKLIAFPEVFIPGYPWHIWMGAPAWAIGRGFVQRYFDNSLAYDSPQAEKLRDAVKAAKLTAVLGVSEREGGSLYIAQWIDRPRWRDHRQAPQAAPDPRGTHRLRRGRRQRPHRFPTRRISVASGALVLLGAPAAAVEIRHVRAGRTGACRVVAELLAVRPVRARARSRSQQRREQNLCGRRLVFRARSLRDSVAGDDRRNLRQPRKACLPACRRRLCGHLWSGRLHR